MAKRIKETLVDDIDGSEAAETVSFGIDGSEYEMELSAKNAKKLRDALAPFITSARKPAGPPRGRRVARRSASTLDRQESAKVRQWAKAQGLTVSERGRIASDIVEKYNKAH